MHMTGNDVKIVPGYDVLPSETSELLVGKQEYWITVLVILSFNRNCKKKNCFGRKVRNF